MTIALLTDFGTADYFVGAMKGAILSINENARIVDITHEIAAQNISQAAFTLRACCKNFPPRTIFTIVVDPGVGSHRRAIAVEKDEYFFVAPDNGLLSFIFEDEKDFRVFELTNERFFAENVSRTFHGRDIFAPVAAHLSNGIRAGEFGAEIKDFVSFKTSKPENISPEEIEAEIIHIDRFGNLITNLEAQDLPGKFAVELNGKTINNLRKFFAEAETNEVFMILGSANFLEIAANQNSAADLLKARIGQTIRLRKIS